MSDYIYIITEGEYEDETIEYVCFGEEEAMYYVRTNDTADTVYRIYKLRMNTKYAVGMEDGIASDHIVLWTGKNYVEDDDHEQT